LKERMSAEEESHAVGKRKGRALIGLLVLALAGFVAEQTQGVTHVPSQGMATREGGALFKLHCSSSYCHGELGRGGGGPALRAQHFEPLKLEEVILHGVPGTAMPEFSSRFSPTEIERIVEYVRTLGSMGLNDTSLNAPVTSGSGSQREESIDEKLEENVTGAAAVGRELFFDANNVNSCRVCHTFQGRGGKVGPDLTNIAARDEAEISESIKNPAARVAAGFEKLQVVTRDGTRFIGVKRDEDATRLRFFDTSTMPPVSHSISKSEIVTRETLPGSAMPAQLQLTAEDVRALIVFLRSR